MKINLKKLLARRKTSDAAHAGFWAGIVAGALMAIFTFLTTLLFKQTLLEEFALIKDKFRILIPYDINVLYLISLLVAPPAILFLYLVAGIFFGLIFDKFKNKTPLNALLMSLLFGSGFGSITNLPADRLIIITASVFAWLLFAFVFLKLYGREGRERSKVNQGKGKLMMFSVLIFILSSSMIAISYLLGIKLVVFAPLYMFIPLISTIITCYFYEIPLTSLGLSIKPNRWFLLAWIFPVFFIICSTWN